MSYNEWNYTYSSFPIEGHFVAIFNDGSGAGLFTALDDGEIVDAEGDYVDKFYLIDNYTLWSYLPLNYKLWYQIKSESKENII
jgi:hypothetical protein